MNRFKKKPAVERTDLKSLADIPVAVGLDVVPEDDMNKFLNKIEAGSDPTQPKESPVVEEKAPEPVEVKEESPKVTSNDFSIDDLDLNSPEEKIEDKPKTKKTKEDNIAELRKKAETYELTLKEREDKLAEYQKRAEELEAELERTAFEKSPKFKEKFAAPFEQAVDKVAQFAREYGDDESLAQKALSLKGRERLQFIDEAFGGGAASAQFLALVSQAEEKRGDLESAIANYKQTHETLVRDEEVQRAQTHEKINRNFERVANHLAQKSEFFRKGDDEDHNRSVDERVKAARNIIMGTASENDMAVAPFLAVIAKDAVAENERLRAELAKYKSRAKEDAAVQPRISRAAESETNRAGKPVGGINAIRAQLGRL